MAVLVPITQLAPDAPDALNNLITATMLFEIGTQGCGEPGDLLGIVGRLGDDNLPSWE